MRRRGLADCASSSSRLIQSLSPRRTALIRHSSLGLASELKSQSYVASAIADVSVCETIRRISIASGTVPIDGFPIFFRFHREKDGMMCIGQNEAANQEGGAAPVYEKDECSIKAIPRNAGPVLFFATLKDISRRSRNARGSAGCLSRMCSLPEGSYPRQGLPASYLTAINEECTLTRIRRCMRAMSRDLPREWRRSSIGFAEP